MAVEFLSGSGGWPLSSWISPGAAFFLFVNVLIGAIVVTSRGHHQAAGGRAAAASTRRRLCRSASSMVLDRLRSFSIFSVHPAVDPMEDECYRTSLEASVAEPAASAAPVAAAGAAPADDGAPSEFAKEEEAEAGPEDDNSISSDDEAAHGLALQGLAQRPLSEAAGAAAAAERKKEKKAAEQEEATMQQRAPACRWETEDVDALEGKAVLNARAESFIRKFREDLKLERLNSIINYTRTLRRGAGAPSPTAQ